MISLLALTWPTAIGLMVATGLIGMSIGLWLGARMSR
jgi:hypothetical protein